VSGLIYIWKPAIIEHWSSFVPQFTELEENIEYVEREDEFDQVIFFWKYLWTFISVPHFCFRYLIKKARK
jgi:hypothetical protein